MFGSTVKVDKKEPLSNERKASIGNRNGVIKKGITDKFPKFHPDKKEE